MQLLQLQAKLLNKQIDNKIKVSLELNLMNLFSDWHMIISLTFISDLESIINKSYEKSIALQFENNTSLKTPASSMN